MPHDPPPAPIADLLIVGGLTVDRFVDGSTAPGGSVLHSGIAAATARARVATVTVAGQEPAAAAGLARLGTIGPLVHQPSPTSVVYAHREADGHRVLILEAKCERLGHDTIGRAPAARVALLAPIADELPSDAIGAVAQLVGPDRIVLLIQGWLRDLRVGEAVRPLALASLAKDLVEAFGHADAIVVSTEDLAEGADDPFGQVRALRQLIGPRPLIVVTLGADGFVLDDPAASRIVASVPRRVVVGVPTVGAGDTFGAGLALSLAAGATPADAAAAGAEAVIAMLESRGSPGADAAIR